MCFSLGKCCSKAGFLQALANSRPHFTSLAKNKNNYEPFCTVSTETLGTVSHLTWLMALVHLNQSSGLGE